MLFKKAQNLILKKNSGQSLLVVLVISTLTMLLLMGVALRIDIGRENARRSGEFDRAFASSENALNDIIASVYSSNCTPTNLSTSEYKKIEGCDALNDVLLKENANVFGKINEGTIEATVDYPVSLNFGEPNNEEGVNLSGVKVTCGTLAALDSRPEIKFLTTIVYIEDSEYKVLKGVSNCSSANTSTSPRGNIKFYNSDTNLILNPDQLAQTIIPNAKLIRVRLLDGSPSTRIGITGELCEANGQNCQDQGMTGSCDFMVVGLGGLGSDNIVKFELSKGTSDNDMNALFDFVFFGEDIP